MHHRRLAAFLMGAWLAGSVLMAAMAAHNLRAVDSLLEAPPYGLAKPIEAIGHAGARALLRHEAAELNRWGFDVWEWAQLVIGPALVATIASRRPHARLVLALSSVMLGAAVIQHWGIAPALAGLVSLADAAALGQPSPEHSRFAGLHFTYMSIEAIKFACGLVVLVTLLRHSTAPAPNAAATLPHKRIRAHG
ncbi:MAG: hypothetical protein ABSG25_10615 [Bryobacteraceae bacterium]